MISEVKVLHVQIHMNLAMSGLWNMKWKHTCKWSWQITFFRVFLVPDQYLEFCTFTWMDKHVNQDDWEKDRYQEAEFQKIPDRLREAQSSDRSDIDKQQIPDTQLELNGIAGWRMHTHSLISTVHCCPQQIHNVILLAPVGCSQEETWHSTRNNSDWWGLALSLAGMWGGLTG